MLSLLLTRAVRDAQRGGLFYPGFAWVSGPIQHSGLAEDAKLPKAAAPLLLLCYFLDGS